MILQRFLILFLSCQCFANGTKLTEYVMKKNDTWVLRNIAQCLLEVTEISFLKDQDVIVLLRESSNDDAVLIAMNYPIVIITEDCVPQKLRHVRNRAIAYIFSKLSIPDILASIPHDARTKFIVLSPTKQEAESMFSLFWEERRVNVVALVYSRLHPQIQIITYFPYTDVNCDTSNQTVLLTTWSPNTEIFAPLFPPKVTDFRKCPLYVTLLLRPPSVIETQDGTMTGIEVLIMEEVAKTINATPIFQLLHEKKTKYRSKDGNILMLELTENHSHAVAGSLLFTDSTSLVSEGIEYSRSTCVSIAVPKNYAQSSFYIFTTLLSGKILFVATFVMIAGFIIFYRIYKFKDASIQFLKACRMLISPLISGSFIKVEYTAARFFFAAWIFSAFIFGKIFEASISSSVLAPIPSPQLENLHDVLHTTLTLRGENFMMREVLPRYLPEKHTVNIDLGSTEEGLAMEMIAESESIAYLGLKNNLKYNYMKNKKLDGKIHIQEECVIKYSPVIQVRKNSPLYWAFSKIIRALAQSGLIEKYFTTVMVTYFDGQTQFQKISNEVPPLTLTQISGAFVVLALGLWISLIRFLAEVIAGYFNKKNSRSKFAFYRISSK